MISASMMKQDTDTGESELMLFEVATLGNGSKVAKRVARECSVAQAAALLGVSRKGVQRLYYAGIIDGWKPGLKLAKMKGGSGKTCKIVLDWDSVMQYREVEREAQRLAREV